MKQKAFFIIFKGLPVVKNCLIPESAPLKSVSGTGAFPVHIAKFKKKTYFEKHLRTATSASFTFNPVMPGAHEMVKHTLKILQQML